MINDFDAKYYKFNVNILNNHQNKRCDQIVDI